MTNAVERCPAHWHHYRCVLPAGHRSWTHPGHADPSHPDWSDECSAWCDPARPAQEPAVPACDLCDLEHGYGICPGARCVGCGDTDPNDELTWDEERRLWFHRGCAERVPDWLCAYCGDVVTVGGYRDGRPAFEYSEFVPEDRDPPLEKGAEPETGEVCFRCEVCRWELGTRRWMIPPHPGA